MFYKICLSQILIKLFFSLLLFMKTQWDYTTLAKAYLQRADYANAAIDALLTLSGFPQNANKSAYICDVGAGVAHLTLMLAERGHKIEAVEPNDAMRELGIERTQKLIDKNIVRWHEGTGEKTNQPANIFDIVSFGSSFNVCDRALALKESHRLLKDGGYFMCLWNHRDLDDAIQSEIEGIIRRHIPTYGYGTRREDQREIIEQSGLFENVVQLSSRVVFQQKRNDCIEAWRSHATLQRQAGSEFLAIISDIEQFLNARGKDTLPVPYTTHAWIAKKK